jgi:hypothetical protein
VLPRGCACAGVLVSQVRKDPEVIPGVQFHGTAIPRDGYYRPHAQVGTLPEPFSQGVGQEDSHVIGNGSKASMMFRHRVLW